MRIHFKRLLENEQQKFLCSGLDEGISITSGDLLSGQEDVRILVAGRPNRDDLEQLPNLDTLIIPWTGIPEETRSILVNFPDLRVHNLHHNAASTAELAISLLMAVAKQIIPMDRLLRAGNWQPRYQNNDTILLSGKNALLVGYGEIGQRIKIGLDGLGVNTKVIRRNPEPVAADNFIHGPDSLHELLPGSEILILAIPYTKDTKDFIDEREFSLLPPTAILINIARGKIVNQSALYRALADKRIFGAGLDVWYNYPDSKEARESTMPGDYPFHELDNLVLSPHRGGMVVETEKLRMEDLARLINAASRGEEIPNQVDLELGY